jgi:hypothetical protein
MRIRTVALLLTLFAAVPATAQSTQEFRSATGNYTLQVPQGWRRLPQAELNRLRQSASGPAQELVGQTFEALYKVRDSRERFPGMAVATVDLGQRLTRAQFRQATTGAHAQAQMQSATDATLAVDRAATMGVPVWDEENAASWTRVAHSTDGRLPPFTYAVGVLHPDGRTMITLSYTGAPGEDEARVRADLLAIVRSLRVD